MTGEYFRQMLRNLHKKSKALKLINCINPLASRMISTLYFKKEVHCPLNINNFDTKSRKISRVQTAEYFAVDHGEFDMKRRLHR